MVSGLRPDTTPALQCAATQTKEYGYHAAVVAAKSDVASDAATLEKGTCGSPQNPFT